MVNPRGQLIKPASRPDARYHAWDGRYPKVAHDFISKLGPLPPHLEFEHVGSTAIPGCGGKGIIDLLALYSDGSLAQTNQYLLDLGFSKQGPEFSKPWPEDRPMLLGYYDYEGEDFLIYVHVVESASDEVRRFRAFRDRVRDDPALLREYCEAKKKIIEAGTSDTDEYTAQKSPIIHKILGTDYELES